MGFNKLEMYYAVALYQIAAHEKSTTINGTGTRTPRGFSSFVINDSVPIYLKYTTAPYGNPPKYQFTFEPNNLEEIAELQSRAKSSDVFIVLVIADDKNKVYETCCLSNKIFQKILDSREWTGVVTRVLLVEVQSKFFHVFCAVDGKRNKRIGEELIPKNCFPDAIFQEDIIIPPPEPQEKNIEKQVELHEEHLTQLSPKDVKQREDQERIEELERRILQLENYLTEPGDRPKHYESNVTQNRKGHDELGIILNRPEEQERIQNQSDKETIENRERIQKQEITLHITKHAESRAKERYSRFNKKQRRAFVQMLRNKRNTIELTDNRVAYYFSGQWYLLVLIDKNNNNSFVMPTILELEHIRDYEKQILKESNLYREINNDAFRVLS